MKNKLVYVFILAFLFRAVLAFLVWHPDLRNHMDWGIRFFQYGPAGFFSPNANVWNYTWPNQPPGTIYIFAFIRKLYEFIFGIFWWINLHVPPFPSAVMYYLENNLYPALLKLPSILSDLGIAYLIYIILGKNKKGIMGSTIFLINPVIWYNSSVWGQTDAIISFLALSSFYFLLKKRYNISSIALALSIFTKISLVIFIPVYLLILIKQKPKTQKLIVSTILTLILIGIITFPFSRSEPFSWLYWLYTKKVLTNQLQVITANAFNIWATIAGIHERPQSLKFIIFSYQNWGYFLFSVPLLYTLFLIWKKKLENNLIWWSLTIISFSSFMFLTNMHERYLYPLFPYFTIIAAKNRKFLMTYWLVSLISLLNLYNFWFTPKINLIVTFLSFGDRLMPRVFGFVNFIVFIFLFWVGANLRKNED